MTLRIRRVTIFFAAFALAVSAGCLRLGFWQVSRLRERQARNADVMSRLQRVPVRLADLRGDTAIRFRRVIVDGLYDFDHELVLTARPRNGAPGVHILTPLRVRNTDTAVLVDRGWVYSPDGMRIDLPLWREAARARVEGFVEEFTPADVPVSTASESRAVRRLDRDSIAARMPYPLYPVAVVQRLDSGEAAAVARGTPVRADPPPLDEGPHRSYAVQWFAFALVGVVGTAYVLARDAGSAASGATGHAVVDSH